MNIRGFQWVAMVTGTGAIFAGELPRDGLLVDLVAGQGVELAEGAVTAWRNQAEGEQARVFRPQDEGRKVAGSGRPTAARVDGAEVLVFKRQELVCFEDDTFDHLTTGSGYTWFCVMRVHPQVSVVKDVNAFFGNLRNGEFYEGLWAGVTDDNRVWAGTRNGSSFGRWDANNPRLLGPELEVGRFHVVAGRLQAGTGSVTNELFVDGAEPVAARPFPVNPEADASRLVIGQERDAVEHPGAESFDGEIARFLLYGRGLTDEELRMMMERLRKAHGIPE